MKSTEAAYKEKHRTYMCIDLKSFYASVECVERGLDPFSANLVVADSERSDRTICLAVSPAMKSLGVPGRCRVFEIPSNIKYIKARPRMQTYIDYSARVYEIYLRYIDKCDIHVYSIDEAFFDVTDYLELYGMNAAELAQTIMDKIYSELGLSSACGIGTNLYLAKIALDIPAKHSAGRIAFLDEELYRSTLWNHRPLTDFWRIGKGIAGRLAHMGIFTMEQIAKADARMMYRIFGVDAELLLDHAWGRETTTMADIKAYRPKSHSMTSGQVLMHDYEFTKARLICAEMTDGLCIELVEKGFATDELFLHVGYAKNEALPSVRGSVRLSFATHAESVIRKNMDMLFEKIVNPQAKVRRLTIGFGNLTETVDMQIAMFDSEQNLKQEENITETVARIKAKYGRNAMIKAMSLEEGATGIERNRQIGGHKA